MRIPPKPLLLTVILLASCSEADRFSVDGVDSEFCVPKKGYISPGVWFVPEDEPGTPSGFSFGGCHRLAQQDQAECTLPREFISADVESLSVKRNVAWSELKDAAVFAAVAADPTAQYSIDPSTQMLVVSSKSVWDEWFVWRRYDPSYPNKQLNDRDRLVVSCTEIENFVRSAGLGKAGEYGCSRYIRGNAYALEYRFISKAPVPNEHQLMQLDSRLFDQVDRWRCSK